MIYRLDPVINVMVVDLSMYSLAADLVLVRFDDFMCDS
jgi:hypothetical protein